MRKYLSAVVTVVALIVIGWAWWTQYVEPKSKTLEAATQCVYAKGLNLDQSAKSKAAWRVCLTEAESQHATALVLALGY